jgi:F1F0 ATPase subunit 2
MIMMNNPLTVILAGAAGVVLGMIFFGGLWWTVRRALVSRRPASWFLGSLLLRMGLVVTGFYFVGDGQWPRLLACLLGFIVARSAVMRLTGKPEARHAP